MSNYTQVEKNGLYELTEEARAELSSSVYYKDRKSTRLTPVTMLSRMPSSA